MLLIPQKAFPQDPKSSFYVSEGEICAPADVTFINISSGGDSYTWYIDGVQVHQTPTPDNFIRNFQNSGTVSAIYLVRLVVEDSGSGLQDEMEREITIYPEINSAFSADQTAGCDPLDVQFTNESTGHTGSWEWNFGDGGSSVQFAPSHVFRNQFDPDDITWEVSLVATSPYLCRDTARLTVTVSPLIEALFAADKVTGCHQLGVTISNQSTGADTYIWDMGDGTIYNHSAATFTHTYTNNSDLTEFHTIHLRVENDEGCFDEMQIPVTVYPGVSAGFTTDPVEGCSPLTVEFTNTSAGSSYYLWDFGDGGTSSEQDPVHTYVKNTGLADVLYQVRLIAFSDNFCSDTTGFTDITVKPFIEADFTLQNMEGCHPLTVTVNNQSTGADTYLWTFSDGSPPSGTGDPEFTRTFTNTTGSIQTYTITLLAENSAHDCFHILQQEVVVYPEVVADFSADPEEGCSELSVQFTNNSSGASQYLWEFGDGGSSALPDPLHTYEKNFSGADIVYEARLIAISAELCRDTTGYMPVTVYPHIEAGFSTDRAEGCHPFTVNITNQSTGAGTYSWDMGDGTIYNTPAASFDHVYSNTGNSTETLTITLSVENPRGCTDTMRREVTVYPELLSVFTYNIIESCEPVQVSFINQSVNATSRHWDFGDGATSLLENPQHSFTNPGTADTVFRVRLTSYSANGECAEESFQDIVVPGRVRAEFSFPAGSGCSPTEMEFINSSLGGESFTWDFGDGTTLNTNSDDPVSHLFLNNSFDDIIEYQVTLTVENYAGCTDQITRTISVYPDIEAMFAASATSGCHPLTVGFTGLSEGASFYSWDFGDGNSSARQNPLHTFNNTGASDSVFRVTLFSTAGNSVCSDSFFMDITVHGYVQAGFDYSGGQACTPSDVLFTNTSVNAQEYHWEFGDGSDSVTWDNDPFEKRFENPGYSDIVSYQVIMTAFNYAGCTSETSRTVNVYPGIAAGFDVSTAEGCGPLTVDFSNLSSGAEHYIWDFGDGSQSALAEPSHTFVNIGNADTVYRVIMTAVAPNNICSDIAYADIRVHPLVLADFSVSGNLQCSPAEIIFGNTSVGGNLFRWDFGDGRDTLVSDTSPMPVTFVNPDYNVQADFTVTLETQNTAGCTALISKTVSVHPGIRAVFDPSVLEGCHPLEVEFENLSEGGYTYNWDFDDGVTTAKDSPRHTFTNFTNTPVARNVTLRATSQNYCSSDTTMTIRINPLPKTFISIDQSVSCAPFDLTVGNATEGAVNYTWMFGDGSGFTTGSAAPFVHTYDNNRDEIAAYDLRLIAETEFGCIDSAIQKIFVYPRVVISFSSITEGCSPLTVRFNDNSTRVITHEWSFGDGNFSRLRDPTHEYVNNTVNDTSYYVQQVGISEYGCRDTMGYHIEVYPQPVGEFTATPVQQVFPSTRVYLENLTNPGYWNYLWNFDDGTTSTLREPGHHDFTGWGDYDVSLYVSGEHCDHVVSHRIRILPSIPAAEFSQPDPGCAPLGVQFVNTSLYGHSYLWEFGDGTTSAQIAPYHVFNESGLYNVKLTVTGDGGTEFAYQEVLVYRQPVVNFTASPLLVMLLNQPVRFFNQTLYGNSYLWDFGDGNESAEHSPVHLYNEEGEYDVSLRVWTEDGCYGEMVEYNLVTVAGEGIIEYPNAFRPDPSGSSGGYYDRNAVNPNTVFYPFDAGVAEYRLEIYNRWGELLFVSEDIEIGWDGYYQGKISKQDVYVWKVWGTFINGEKFVRAGDVTLLR